MVKSNIKVCVRTRPTKDFADEIIRVDSSDNKSIQIQSPFNDNELNNKQSNYCFVFDDIFHKSSQSDIYDHRARDTVLSAVDGINGAILTYGQTGSGKTFTMLGDSLNFEHRGIAPRAINQVFHEIGSRYEYEFKVLCSYIEIYNDKIFDLLHDLSDPSQCNQSQNLEYVITEDKDGKGTYARGINEIEVESERDTLNLLFGGELARTTATHKLNRRSNRSHSIFTLYIQKRPRSGSNEKIIHSKLHLVDLAGSERIKKTMENAGDEVTRKESMAINQSLSFLEQCVVALARRGQSHIPYRQSKLTNLLKDCLGANCNTLVIACIWGEEAHIEETISTLRFASRMMRVENEVTRVETIDERALMKKQAREIKTLKQELAMHDIMNQRIGLSYEPFTQDQRDDVRRMLAVYLEAEDGDDDTIDIKNVRQMYEICKQFKQIILQSRQELEMLQNEIMQRNLIPTNEPALSNQANESISNPVSTNQIIHKNNCDENENALSVTASHAASNRDVNIPALNGKVRSVGVPEVTTRRDANTGRETHTFALGTATTDYRPAHMDSTLPVATTSNLNVRTSYHSSSITGHLSAQHAISSNSPRSRGKASIYANVSGPDIAGINKETQRRSLTSRESLFNSHSRPDLSPIHSDANGFFANDNSNLNETANSNNTNQSNYLSPSAQKHSNRLFDIFVQNEGNAEYVIYIECKRSIKEQKTKLKDLSTRLNDSKTRIDELYILLEQRKIIRAQQQQVLELEAQQQLIRQQQQQLEQQQQQHQQKQQQKSGQKQTKATNQQNAESNSSYHVVPPAQVKHDFTGIIDDEEFRILRDIKETKLKYKNGYIHLQKTKENYNILQTQLAQVKFNLVESFCQWNNSPAGQTFASYQVQPPCGEQRDEADISLSMSHTLSSKNSLLETYNRNKTAKKKLMQDDLFYKLEQQQQQMSMNNPESIPFFDAQKTKIALYAQNNSNIKRMHRYKRLG